MNIIKLNDAEFQVESYNKTTTFSGENISSSAYCQVNTDNINTLNELAADPITSIQILHDGDLIYNLQNINAKIDNINESLSMDRIFINVNLTFTM